MTTPGAINRLQAIADRRNLHGVVVSVAQPHPYTQTEEVRAAAQGMRLLDRTRQVYALKLDADYGGDTDILGTSERAAAAALRAR